MKLSFSKIFLYFISSAPFCMVAQLDPEIMTSLTNLPSVERERLLKQYGFQDTEQKDQEIISNSSESQPEFSGRSEQSLANEEERSLLEDLQRLEQILSANAIKLEVELVNDNIELGEIENINNALQENKKLLRKIKELQFEEIERETKKLKDSAQNNMLKPFGYDLFLGIQQKPLMIDAPVPAEYRIGPGDMIEVQLFGQRNESYTLEISKEGIIRFPRLDQLMYLKLVPVLLT